MSYYRFARSARFFGFFLVTLIVLTSCQKKDAAPMAAPALPPAPPPTPTPAPVVVNEPQVIPLRRCRDRYTFDDLRSFPRPSHRGYLSYRDLVAGSYEAEQVTIMYSLPYASHASFLFSQSISAPHWKAEAQPVVQRLEPGDFNHYFSQETWGDLNTRFRQRIQYAFDLPLYMRKRGNELIFSDAVQYSVGFEHGGRSPVVVARRAYPYAGANPIFSAGFLEGRVNPLTYLVGPAWTGPVRRIPVYHSIEQRNGYIRFTIHYQQPRIHLRAACLHGCSLVASNEMVDVYIQVLYAVRTQL